MTVRLTTRQSERVRAEIKVSHIVKRLLAHFDGEVELTATQLKAGLALLSKVLPDLKAHEHTGEISHRGIGELTRAELERIAASGCEGSSEAERLRELSTEVH